jgi:hypothetical protein
MAMIFFTIGLGGGVLPLTQINPPTNNTSSTAPTSNARPKYPSGFFGRCGAQDGSLTIVFNDYLPHQITFSTLNPDKKFSQRERVVF